MGEEDDGAGPEVAGDVQMIDVPRADRAQVGAVEVKGNGITIP